MFCELIERWTLPLILFFVFIAVLAGFAGFYQCIYNNGRSGETNIKGKRVIGVLPPEPTFNFSEAYIRRSTYQIQVDLRVRPFFGNVQPITWMHFDPDPPPPFEGIPGPSLEDIGLRGLSAKEMLESKFEMYGAVAYNYWTMKDGTQKSWMLENQINVLPTRLVQKRLVSPGVASEIKQEMWDFHQMRKSGTLYDIRSFTMGLVSKYRDKSTNGEELEKVIYGSTLVGFSQGAWLTFDHIVPSLNYWDFLYYTLTGYGEISPINKTARIANVVQYFFVYIYLSIFVAVIITRLPKFE